MIIPILIVVLVILIINQKSKETDKENQDFSPLTENDNKTHIFAFLP